MKRRNAKCPAKTVAVTTAELLAELEERREARGDAVFAPISLEDQDELPQQSLPMAVVRRWFA